MNRSILGFATLLVAALVIGTAFGIRLGYDPRRPTARDLDDGNPG